MDGGAPRGSGLRNARYCVKLIRNSLYSAAVRSASVRGFVDGGISFRFGSRSGLGLMDQTRERFGGMLAEDYTARAA